MTTLHEIEANPRGFASLFENPDAITTRTTPLEFVLDARGVRHDVCAGDFVYMHDGQRWMLLRILDDRVQLRAFGTTPAPSSIEEALAQVAE